MSDKLLEIKNLSKKFPVYAKTWGKTVSYTKAVSNLSLDVYKGEILAIAGESGCGKTTLGRCIMQLEKPSEGEIFYDKIKLNELSEKELKPFRQKAQIIFQNPYASLNPKMTVFQILKEPLVINKFKKEEIQKRVEETVGLVGLDVNDLKKYPHEFSGGQRQRIAIARSLILKPEFVIADEPVSALDVSIQAQIINLLLELKEKLQLTIIFISHDLGVIRQIADRVAIMYLGEIIELGEADEIFESPAHPYTKLLLSSVPSVKQKEKNSIQNDLGITANKNSESNCKFFGRCPIGDDVCKNCEIQVKQISDSHYVKCLKY